MIEVRVFEDKDCIGSFFPATRVEGIVHGAMVAASAALLDKRHRVNVYWNDELQASFEAGDPMKETYWSPEAATIAKEHLSASSLHP